MINVQSAMIEPQPFFNVQTGVLFELYTLRNPRNVQYLRINDVESLANSYFDASRPTRIVIHGFNSKGDLTVAFQRGNACIPDYIFLRCVIVKYFKLQQLTSLMDITT